MIEQSLKRLKRFGTQRVYVAVESSVDKSDESIVREYEQRGFANFYYLHYIFSNHIS